jgi:hypothetical protein
VGIPSKQTSRMSDMNESRALNAVSVYSGIGYTFGGLSKPGELWKNSAEKMSLSANEWVRIPQMSERSIYNSCALFEK